MELNYCLYCEKKLADDNLAFCSLSCQSGEASKSTYGTLNYKPISQQPNKMHSIYQMSYHRRPSLSYSISSSSTTSNKSLNKIKQDSFVPGRRTSVSSYSQRTPFSLNSSSFSTTSSFSTISDASLYSVPCSCDDKTGNTFVPFQYSCATNHFTTT